MPDTYEYEKKQDQHALLNVLIALTIINVNKIIIKLLVIIFKLSIVIAITKQAISDFAKTLKFGIKRVYFQTIKKEII